MATNRANSDGRYVSAVVTAGLKSNAPTVVGQIPGVLLIDADATTNIATIDTKGVYNLIVDGINAGGNVAVAAGDIVYFTVANTPPLSKVATGVRFGYALDAVASGNHVTTIRVKLGY